MGSVENVRAGKNLISARKLPRRVSQMSKEVLEATLRKKQDCNTKALQIVQRLVENVVDESWFLDCLKFISDSHYQDVTEERAITKLCGYPLCSESLKDIPSKQFHISTRLNKVYDLTERKNFCSNQCYKASTYLKRQLLTSPLWLRDNEEIPKFVLLPVHSSGGGVGEEIDIGQSNPLKEELKQLYKKQNPNNFTSVSDFMKNSLSKLSSDVDRAELKEKKKKQEILKQSEQNNATEKDVNINSNNSNDEPNEAALQSHNEVKQICEVGNDKAHQESSTSTLTFEATKTTAEGIQGSYLKESLTDNKDDSNFSATKDIHISSELITKCDTEKLSETELNVLDKATDKCDTKNIVNANSSESSINGAENNDSRRDELTSSKGTSAHKKKTRSKKNKDSEKQSDFIHPMTRTVIHIEKCLHEWFTLESMCFLFGEERMKEMVSEKGECIKEYYKVVQNASWDPKVQEQYMSICKRLNLMEIEENQLDNNVQMATKPIPDYETIKEEGKKLELKVKAFFQGKAAYEGVESSSKTDFDNGVPAVLPIVDLHAQKCLRRKIVRDRLNRVVPDLLRTFGVSSDVTKDIRNLVATFGLEANNINFQPLEWNLIGMVIIKMLSIRDIRLKILLDNEEVTKYVTMMLMVFQQDGGYLDRLMGWLTDLDNILRKQ